MSRNRISIADILRGVQSVFINDSLFPHVQTLESLTEGISDTPTIQIFPETRDVDTRSGGTDRSAFRGGVRVSEVVINMFVYADQRSYIEENMLRLVAAIDAIDDILEQQDVKPYFGVDGLKAFRWGWSRAVIEMGEPMTKYVGVLYTLTFTVF